MNFGFSPLERLLEPITLVRGYLIGLAFLPVLLALSIAQALNRGSIPNRMVIGAVIGYNALAVVSSLTAAALAVLIILLVLSYSRALRIRLDLRAAFRTVAVCIGYGTAAGVVTAALLPFMSSLLPIGYQSEQSDANGLTPQLLVDVPAGFAVVGYGIGIAHAVALICGPAENLVLRRFTAPGVLMGTLIAFACLGYGPFGILRAMIKSMPDVSSSDCTNVSITEHLDNPSWLLKAIDICGGGGVYLGDQSFLWCAAIVVGLIAVAAFVMDFRNRARNLKNLDVSDLTRPGAPSSGRDGA